MRKQPRAMASQPAPHGVTQPVPQVGAVRVTPRAHELLSSMHAKYGVAKMVIMEQALERVAELVGRLGINGLYRDGGR